MVKEINEPKVIKEIATIVVKYAIVEGYSQPVIMVENKEMLPTEKVVEFLNTAAFMLTDFPDELDR